MLDSTLRWFSLLRVAVWIFAIPVAWYYGWIYSVAFVAVCSLYANLASDFAAWRSDVNPDQERLERMSEQIEEIRAMVLNERGPGG